jgi:MFS family permease
MSSLDKKTPDPTAFSTPTVTSSPTSTIDLPSTENEIHPIHTIPSRLSRAQSNSAHDPEKSPTNTSLRPIATNTRQVVGLKWFLVCISLYTSAFLYGLDTTIAADVQGAVITSFGHIEQLAWIGAGFPLGSVSVIILVGALYTSFNMKWIFIGGLVLFEVGSVICGAAPSMNAIIVGRVIAGAGGSGIYLGGLNYFSSLTAEEERGLYVSGIGFVWGLGAVLGPVIGGAFSVSPATWRWAFYINLVVGAVTAPIYVFDLPSLRPVRGVSVKDRLRRLDWVGFGLFIGIWVSFTLATTMAGGEWAWGEGRTIATFVVSAVLVIIYSLQQYFTILTTPDTRSFPGDLLKSRTQLLLFIATAANITSLFVVVYFIPIYFQFVHDDTALMAAVRLLPFLVFLVVSNLLSGHLLPKIQYYQAIYLVSGILILLGGALLMTNLDPATPTSRIYGLTILIGVGTGITVQSSYTIATIKVSTEEIGDAITFQNISQIGGTVLALVIAGQVFQSTAVRNLSEVLVGQGFSQEDIHDAVAGAQSVLFGKLTGELREAAVLAIVRAMQKAFLLVVVAGAVVTVAGAGLRFERLFKGVGKE